MQSPESYQQNLKINSKNNPKDFGLTRGEGVKRTEAVPARRNKKTWTTFAGFNC